MIGQLYLDVWLVKVNANNKIKADLINKEISLFGFIS